MRQYLLILTALFCAHSYAIEEVIQPTSSGPYSHLEVQLTPKEKNWLTQNPDIRVAVKSAWMPIEFKLESERHRGVAVDYLNAISQVLNISFSIVDFPEDSEPGEVDIPGLPRAQSTLSGSAIRDLRESQSASVFADSKS